ncbi:MAG: hypothetical protein R3Y28_01460 [Candidatus Gastranaerophilales bacterium]
MTENFKKLTGKNRKDYEQVAFNLINNAEVELFSELIDKDDFIFDFIKQNVANRLAEQINEKNYKNLLKFLPFYSPSYEDFIVSALIKYADEDLTDELLELLENGNTSKKTYITRYFAFIHDPLALELLRKYAYCENDFLASNCAYALSKFKDKYSYDLAIEKLNSDDDFETLSAVKFLINYGDKLAIDEIMEVMKKSSMPENIAGEIPYLINLFELLKIDYSNALLVIFNIINGLGEILGLSTVLDYQLYDIFQELISSQKYDETSIILLNAIEKFDILTENDEYLFDEDKNTKQEILEIKKLLKNVNKKELYKNINSKLNENSPYVCSALDFATDLYAIRELLKSNNQMIILKTVEVLKKLDNLDESTKTVALLKVSDGNIKSIIRAL